MTETQISDSAVEAPPSAELDERRAFVTGLRELADMMEAGEAIPLPYSTEISVFADSADEFARAVKSIPGRVDKRTWGEGKDAYMEVRRKLGPVTLSLNAPRSTVCTPRIIGQEKVEVEEIVTPAVTTTRTVERDVISWDCEPILPKAA